MRTELELKTGKRRNFPSQVAKVLVARGMGKEVQPQNYETRQLAAESVPDEAEEAAPARKAKRKYTRRDLTAED